jgi:SAM-dependent methyltransferase
MTIPSEFDNNTFLTCREHLNSFIKRTAGQYQKPGDVLLEVGPQERSEVKVNFTLCDIHTLDVTQEYSPDIVGDLTQYNSHIQDSTYDIVTCLEVLEHTVNPFSAIAELRRITKDNGLILLSAPLNWRIHGPAPDCWRFTEFGWKVLLKDFNILELDKLDTPDRNLFPLKYNILAQVDKSKNVDIHTMKFALVD